MKEQLLAKIIKEFPEIPINKNTKIYRIYSNNDGAAFKWESNGEGAYIFSYDSMAKCLNNKLSAIYCSGSGNGPAGWMVGID